MKHRVSRTLTTLLALALLLSLIPTALAASAYDRPNQKLACLTFDDGPGKYSDQILDILKAHNAKATFFMNGYKVHTYADQIRRMVAEGHQIGNHTYNHPYLAKSSDATIRKEVNSTAAAFTEVTGLTGTGETGFYLRPPYGSYNKWVAQVANVPVIWCTVDSADWSRRDASHLVRYVGAKLGDGDIVVMHETVPSTAQGMDALLTALEKKGLELVTVEDMLWRRGITPQPGTIYYSAKNTGVNRCEKALYWDETRLDTHWAWESISAVLEQGLMSRNVYGEFTPQFPLTRGMFVTMLGRLHGVSGEAGPSGFSDLSNDHYAAPYAAWASETGLMVGTGNGTFQPEKPITRQELASVLARYADLLGANAAPFDLNLYRDCNDIAPWARQGVSDASALGLLKGADNAFSPNQTATRAMGAVVLQRLGELKASLTPAQPIPDESTPAEGSEGSEMTEATIKNTTETPTEDTVSVTPVTAESMS